MPSIPQKVRRRRVLIVDDELAARAALAQLLVADYDVMVASDGIEGAEAALTFLPDLIISDVTMPRLDGLAMVQRIRSQQSFKTPVIFLTALDSPKDTIAGIAAGARNYLTKPVDADDLERRVARAMGLTLPPREREGKGRTC